jgi:curved DNA-binding protein CbpA
MGRIRFILLILSLFISFQIGVTTEAAGRRFTMASFNVENLFDNIHDEGKNDGDYLPNGKAKWTDEKLARKLDQVAAQIRSLKYGGKCVEAIPHVRDEILRRVEQAYEVLSHPEQRKAYDRAEGHDGRPEFPGDARAGNVVSIDRVPLMDATALEEDLLVAPSTDFNQAAVVSSPLSAEAPSPTAIAAASEPGMPGEPSADAAQTPRLSLKGAEASLAREISEETEWRGEFLRRVREGRRISIEEMAATTKVSKTYLTAIEKDDYPKLPAAVFLRGFVTQIAKLLKLPHEQVASAYMNRYLASKGTRN